MISQETKDRIKDDARKYAYCFDYSSKDSVDHVYSSYVDAAEAEAERSSGLLSALEKVRKYFPDTTGHAQDIDKALNQYNKP